MKAIRGNREKKTLLTFSELNIHRHLIFSLDFKTCVYNNLLCNVVQVMDRCKVTKNKFGGLGFSWPTLPTETQASNGTIKLMHCKFFLNFKWKMWLLKTFVLQYWHVQDVSFWHPQRNYANPILIASMFYCLCETQALKIKGKYKKAIWASQLSALSGPTTFIIHRVLIWSSLPPH